MEILNFILNALIVPIRWLNGANSLVYSHLGFWGQVAFDLSLFYLLLLIAFRIAKTALSVVFYVAVPSLVLSFVSSFVLPFNFSAILPVCVALLIVINILRL